MAGVPLTVTIEKLVQGEEGIGRARVAGVVCPTGDSGG